MELILSICIFTLVFGGLALGLVLTGRPPRTACEGVSCIGGGRCDVCPRRLQTANSDD
ncbi:hypothetical protein SAMN05444004_11355 [Jannaschia faecimaris]|uniref:Uncharacterized protein n=1 Tax=Jannaschia faecimaris TaxID=1244108 RepID=A0A1H3STW1_9RHOB|nr:hypothetical protein SAMN05444004_11355 [Jannaschia faecimaris]